MIDIKGKTYGELVVIELTEVKRYKSVKNTQTKAYWLCKCSCGEQKVIRGEHLKSGRIISCGHIAKQKASDRMKKLMFRHGLSHTPTYNSYISMTARVLRPDNHHKKYYADITICDRWLGVKGFDNFLKDMGERPTPKHELDRIDNDGNYEPGNCRWATHSENMQNTRRAKHYN